MMVYVVMGNSGIWSDTFWSVKAFTSPYQAEQFVGDLRSIIDEFQLNETEEDTEAFSEKLKQKLVYLDPQAIVDTGFIDYYIDEVELVVDQSHLELN